jgi:uncharacterized protein YllA (UPF0747 family)
MTLPIQVFTESLGGSPLSIAARAGELPEWYPPLPRDADAWSGYADAVRRSVAATWLSALAPALDAHGAAAERLQRAHEQGGVVITTGQQPGLFGGPLMTFVKALTARAAADELELLIGRPVAPVFWAATDDADFDEASVVAIATRGGAEELKHERGGAAGLRMTDVPLQSDVLGLGERLLNACGSAPNREAVEAVLRAYQPGATVGGAYVSFLRRIMEPLGIAVLDASHAAVAASASDLLRRAAARADDVAQALAARTREITERGFHPQVEEVAGLSLVFTREQGIKRRLSIAEAARVTDTESLSSTVLLRPVLERCILPTATYVGGPGEFAYFAQVSAVAESLGAPVPRVMPRWSTTLLEARIERLLAELGISRDDVGSQRAESRIARRLVPPDVSAALAELRAQVDAGTHKLASATDGLVSPRVLAGIEAGIAHRLDRGERRILAAVKRREREIMERLGTVRGSLAPFGGRQERSLSYVPFLARYGAPLVEAMSEAARAHARARLGVGAAHGARAAAIPQPG